MAHIPGPDSKKQKVGLTHFTIHPFKIVSVAFPVGVLVVNYREQNEQFKFILLIEERIVAVMHASIGA